MMLGRHRFREIVRAADFADFQSRLLHFLQIDGLTPTMSQFQRSLSPV
jgi:hypothetical protein